MWHIRCALDVKIIDIEHHFFINIKNVLHNQLIIFYIIDIITIHYYNALIYYPKEKV
jgi:hypothetical protein